jgi:glycosyltransferase involved in cell wall biosynthesis
VRLAWFSPLPPFASGIADYSHEILPLIAERAGVEVYSPPPYRSLRRLKVPPGVTRWAPRRFASRARSYDAVLYHLGNNPHHKFMYETVLNHPGIVVFHDFVMHHLIADMWVESHRDRVRYEELLTAEYGEIGHRLTDLRFHGVATDFEKFLYPLNAHLARAARLIVVHNEETRTKVEELAPQTPVRVIPHHAGAPPPSVAGVDRAEARRRLNLSPDALLVGHFGYITRPKQPLAVLGGFARLASRRPGAQLVMIGADNTGGGMDRTVDRLGLREKVQLAGFVDLDHFYLYLKAVDAVINLRYPSAGESSGTFARALAEGRPVIVNNLGSFAEVPPDVVLKVEVDGDQADEVGAHLIRLAEDPAFRTHVEGRAREYAAEFLDPRRCAGLYVAAAQEAAHLSRPAPARA